MTTGIGDGSPFPEVAGGVVTESVSGRSPLDSDGGGDVAKDVEDIRNGDITDGLRLRDEVSIGNACLRFLLDNSNRYRRVVGICDSCEFVLSEVDDGPFRLGALCVIFDDNVLRLRLHGTGGDFSVRVEPDEDDKATDARERFFLSLRVLNSFRRLFFAMRFFFAFRARVFHYQATCVRPFFACKHSPNRCHRTQTLCLHLPSQCSRNPSFTRNLSDLCP